MFNCIFIDIIIDINMYFSLNRDKISKRHYKKKIDIKNKRENIHVYYSKIWLNPTSLGPTFVFGIDRCSA
jgi:exonuclease I